MRHLKVLLIPLATLLAGCELFLGAPGKVATITIEPDTVILAENETVPVKVVARDGNGTVMPDVSAYWTSRDYTIANFGFYEEAGVYGIREGTAVIEAHVDGKIATATVIVTRGVVKSINAHPNRSVLATGQQMLLSATAQDATGRVLINRTVTFASANANATVTPQGMVRGVAPGLATIVVTSEGVATNISLRVMPTSVAFNFYKRGGTATPGTATLTFATGTLTRGTLAIDGRSMPVIPVTNYDAGVTCVLPELTSAPAADAITRCVSDPLPLTMRLCTSVNGVPDGQLQYVLMPQADTGRVPATASALLAAVQSNTFFLGINVYSNCAPSVGGPNASLQPRWVRNAPGTDFYHWPNTSGVHPAASVAALLDGAAIFSTPAAGNNFREYVAVRVSATLFEVWH